MAQKLPHFPWPRPDEAVRDALQAAYADGSWGRYHGPHTARLAEALAEYHDTQHVTLASSGTIAVELALRGLKVGAGDEVILSGYDFPGNFRAIEAVGAQPVVVDIRPETWCLDAEQLPAALSGRTRALIVSHLHGGLAPMRRVMELARQRGVCVVEDACQTPGGRVDGRIAGTWGDVGVLSFGGSKLLTAGRGGAVLTPRADVHQRIKIFAHRGNDAFPMSELQAAVLLPQLAQLDAHNARRRRNVDRVLQRLAGVDALQPVCNAAEAQPAYYKLAWLLRADGAGASRDQLVDMARARGVPIDAGFRGFAGRSPRRGRRMGDLAHSRAAATGTVLLHHPVLLEAAEVIDELAAHLRDALQKGAL